MYMNKHTHAFTATIMTEHNIERFGDLSYDSETGAYQFYYDRESPGPLSQSVAHLTTLLSDGGPESGQPLSNSIDPDSLDRLFTADPSRNHCNDHLTFTHRNCMITVHRSGRIVVYPPSPMERPAVGDQ